MNHVVEYVGSDRGVASTLNRLADEGREVVHIQCTRPGDDPRGDGTGRWVVISRERS